MTSLSISENTYKIKIEVNPATTVAYLKVDYIIYNTELSLFSSGGGFFSSSDFVGPDYQKLHRFFLPIHYSFLGFQSIEIRNQDSLRLKMSIDEDAILEISGDQENPLHFGRVTVLTIGVKSNFVCS